MSNLKTNKKTDLPLPIIVAKRENGERIALERNERQWFGAQRPQLLSLRLGTQRGIDEAAATSANDEDEGRSHAAADVVIVELEHRGENRLLVALIFRLVRLERRIDGRRKLRARRLQRQLELLGERHVERVERRRRL